MGPVATEQDITDALLIAEQAREETAMQLDYGELELFDTLRAAGWTWERIGEHLGYGPGGARQGARGRYERLRRRRPGYQPREGTGPASA